MQTSTRRPDEAFATRHGSLWPVGWGLHRPATDLSATHREGAGANYRRAPTVEIRVLLPFHI